MDDFHGILRMDSDGIEWDFHRDFHRDFMDDFGIFMDLVGSTSAAWIHPPVGAKIPFMHKQHLATPAWRV